ncbi:hypothetical protein [Bacteroides ovatus]|jgi:hypothetical protein|uniref:hypothetical protein n=1 Tax=Bacteroides ovatus TaxID=28116 RepID=UPI00204AC413|nr:hypothetical protein [Bacteroides ovatus]UYI64313.1 MAG: hypothetical protein OGM04_02535 [Bacteroides ovatus]DAU81521.1 MAG TPA: hypothetical protein [Caudoviricetes sp.]
MKRYTAKQMETFKEMVNNNILSQIVDDNFFTSLCEKVGEIDEGKFIYEQIGMSGVIDEYDARGELGELIQCSLQVQDNRHRLAASIINLLRNYVAKYSKTEMIDRKLFIQLLGLRAYATKADIMKELDELL